ncbi:hypothetical protein EDB19DRAFT_1824413 [Suillus lakei]|nr:hypothetical protein EDB19DRAFT_1824413 [Suillus lakei]
MERQFKYRSILKQTDGCPSFQSESMAPSAGPMVRSVILPQQYRLKQIRRIGYKNGLALYLIGTDILVGQMHLLTFSQVPYSAGHQRNSRRMEGCGLSTLEVAANSYITVLGSLHANATGLGTVQWFVQKALAEEIDDSEVGTIYSNITVSGCVHLVVLSFCANFLVDQKVGTEQSKTIQLLSFCQITFTISRFIGVAILNFIDPALLLAIYEFCCSLFCLLISRRPGYRAVGCIFYLFFSESICYPPRYEVQTKRGTGLIVMVSPLVCWHFSIQGVSLNSGCCWYPLTQGALADRAYTRRSYLVPTSGFIAATIHAV